jgi:phosphatidylglycerophosphate synthase
MPVWMTPDKLTGIGFFGAVVISLGYGLSNLSANYLWLASLGLIINWFGDSLDGTLARYRGIERPRYGFFIDHTVDALNEFLIVIGLGLTPYIRFDIALLALSGYLLMSNLVSIRTYVEGVFQISYGRLGPTEVRVILIALNVLMVFAEFPSLTLSFGIFTVYDGVVLFIALLLVGIYMVSMLQQARALKDGQG